jgi:hypothetical protein
MQRIVHSWEEALPFLKDSVREQITPKILSGLEFTLREATKPLSRLEYHKRAYYSTSIKGECTNPHCHAGLKVKMSTKPFLWNVALRSANPLYKQGINLFLDWITDPDNPAWGMVTKDVIVFKDVADCVTGWLFPEPEKLPMAPTVHFCLISRETYEHASIFENYMKYYEIAKGDKTLTWLLCRAYPCPERSTETYHGVHSGYTTDKERRIPLGIVLGPDSASYGVNDGIWDLTCNCLYEKPDTLPVSKEYSYNRDMYTVPKVLPMEEYIQRYNKVKEKQCK